MSAEANRRDRFSITTPLYYVNDLPHIGSAYTTIAADVLSRFYHMQGVPVMFVTGTDEHGLKIQRTADSLGRTPQDHCDQVVVGFEKLWQLLEIGFDRFIRTTNPQHEAIVKEFFQRLWDKGDIYVGQQTGWYCVSCEEFKEERDLLEGHYCPIHVNKKVEWKDEQNYFFRLSKYQADLEALYAEKPDFVQPDIRRNEVLGFIKQGLKDFSISRVNVTWGIPLPMAPEQTIYVWFDALLGYISALLEPDAEPTLANATKTWYPFSLHLIGKDILRFHAVSFPAMLLSAGLPLPERVFVHGYLTKDGQKMGKSLGNALNPFELIEQFGSDAVRYYFLKEIEFGRDGDFNEQRFINVLNADLANDFGNLLNRTLKMAHKYFGGTLPEIPADVKDSSLLHELGQTLGDRVITAYQKLAFSEACAAIIEIVQAGNKYIDEQAPWKLYKQSENHPKVAYILYSVLESVRLAAYLLSPITPKLSTAVYQQLGFSVNFGDQSLIDVAAPFNTHVGWGILPASQVFNEPQPVFQKLESLATVSS
ncbi:MAG TPA: methionine--tRNA ligase [Leptolyngbyaceae cyanobacterium M33_DOE_097]|uniref:Methionine--tRNA ligase n=1 Tax=Oscillatoriales cyanobacterium SpSt-418 TaxID=2282169 RepID=A0A7C3KGN2_9CYAN|nr:methionine--tRNA ligase [Leptolyngbyaceae cyanobacterium M33_DOE_097]